MAVVPQLRGSHDGSILMYFGAIAFAGHVPTYLLLQNYPVVADSRSIRNLVLHASAGCSEVALRQMHDESRDDDVEIAMNSRVAWLTRTFMAGEAVRARRHRARRSGACTGFTLIEVVVALALVAVLLTAIGAVVTTTSRGTRSLEQHLALVETTRIVAATLPKDVQISLDGLSGEILGHRWRVGLSPFVSGGINPVAGSPWIPQTVVVRVRSPSGAVYGFETVRLQRRVVQ